MRNANDEYNSGTLEAAIEYRDNGLIPAPIAQRSDWPPEGWKQPNGMPPTVEALCDWWGRNPIEKVGLRIGGDTGLLAIDVEAGESEEDYQHLVGNIRTPTILRENGGRIRLFAMPKGGGVANSRILSGITVQGEDRYIPAPPTMHFTGTIICWDEEHGLDLTCPFAPFPSAVIDLLEEQATTGSKLATDCTGSLVSGNDQHFELPDSIPVGQRWDTLLRYAWSLREERRPTDDVMSALNRANRQRCQSPLDSGVLRLIIAHAPALAADDCSNGRAITKSLAEVVPEPVEWLWRGYIPKGKLTVLEGDPGVGKSTFTLDLAARVTSLGEMPDESRTEVGTVLLLSAEDGVSDTIIPRLSAAGADLESVRVLTEIQNADGEPHHPSIPDDIYAIENQILRHSVRLVIIDPINAYLSNGVNSWSDQDVRRALAPLAQMADRTGAAVILVRHLNKKQGVQALYRGGGSIGIAAAARSVLLIAKHQDHPDHGVLASTKNNLSRSAPAWLFSIESRSGGTSGIKWNRHVDIDADQLLGGDDKVTKLEEAMAFLWDRLGDGQEVPVKELEEDAEAVGIKSKTLKRARAELRVQKKKDGFGKDGSWSVYIPSDASHTE